MGFEPTRAEHNGLAVHRLNHSATSSFLPHDAQIRLFKLIFQIVTWNTSTLCIAYKKDNNYAESSAY